MLDVVKKFFQEFTLSEAKEFLGNWLESGLVTENGWFDSPEDRGTLLVFYRGIEELLEVAFLFLEISNHSSE